MFSVCRERIACENCLIALNADLDHLVQDFLAACNCLQYERKQVALQCRNNLRHDDDQSRMDLFIAESFLKSRALLVTKV